tara:strand:- start:519 stop:731 length:213 start_codon:yes stop_codon:yes gene_type:complete
MVRLFSILATALATSMPALAWACPACAANAGDGYVYATLLMLLIPFALMGILGWWLLRNGYFSNNMKEKV